MDIENLIESFFKNETEIYNEFSLQHELGIYLRNQNPKEKIQFERNVSYFEFDKVNFIKREIDISIFSQELSCAIELKHPKNGQYPEQMYSFCKDIVFIEQLKKAGFKRAFLLILVDDPLFYSGKGNGIYSYFRKNSVLHGDIEKPTGSNESNITLNGTYEILWKTIDKTRKYALIEAQ